MSEPTTTTTLRKALGARSVFQGLFYVVDEIRRDRPDIADLLLDTLRIGFDENGFTFGFFPGDTDPEKVAEVQTYFHAKIAEERS